MNLLRFNLRQLDLAGAQVLVANQIVVNSQIQC